MFNLKTVIVRLVRSICTVLLSITQGGEEGVANLETKEDTLELVLAEQVARWAGHGVV